MVVGNVLFGAVASQPCVHACVRGARSLFLLEGAATLWLSVANPSHQVLCLVSIAGWARWSVWLACNKPREAVR